MMQETNLCRQVMKAFSAYVNIPESVGREYAEDLSPIWNVVDLIGRSRKFILPYTGRLFEDRQYRGIDENEPLRLPFPVIALEYFADKSAGLANPGLLSSKRLVLAREEEFGIVVTPVIWVDKDQVWGPMPECVLPSTGYLDRSSLNDGYAAIIANFADPRMPIEDYADELGALLTFLSAIQCSNVKVDRIERKKERAKLKAPYPFDTYHVLTIETKKTVNRGGSAGISERHSPREHLRRGHIRRLESGAKVWVNAAVVNAGVYGKVNKDYRVS